MTIAIISQNKQLQPWRDALLAIEPQLDIRLWPDIGNPEDIQFALVWNHPAGCFVPMKRLKTISSMGAGVDGLLADKHISDECQIVRLVDPGLASTMSEYLLAVVSAHRQHLGFYRTQQLKQRWSPKVPIPKHELTVGIMGLGQIGKAVATDFADSGFVVSGWSNSPKSLNGVSCFFGNEQLSQLLTNSKALINLLPLTSKTRGIIDQTLLGQLPHGALLINVGRGAHVNDEGLLSALSTGQLSAAFLDVFNQEPLDKTHPFWHQENLYMTPHVSSLTEPKAVAPQIIENYQRTISEQPLVNLVDKKAGY
ncbi:glyoxylate/hydroxypyruvate reductase A [Aliikangiella marina]|uniref:Glyoxylate/hydroxypyruvate reductase A n=1 Tax=Aliikangiella marina TaxID=1712262 RepID=A0A545T6Y6_9GAMM|nr:glyoxylate/hydroxypyruvate reductase A [Aliikangiella marina]TQV72987.1 glyoxylate/hydroxypyruvate reductase A [Aliikangiella marina]